MTDRDQLLAELHRRRAAIDAEIADIYAGGATKQRRKRVAIVRQDIQVSDETISNVSKALSARGIR